MGALNDWRRFAAERLDRPAAVLELLVHLAPALPRSRVDAVADLLADPLARWAREPDDVLRIAAAIHRLPIDAASRDALLRRAQAANERFAPDLTPPLPEKGRPSPGQEAAERWGGLPPQARARALDELLASLETWTGVPYAAPVRPAAAKPGGRAHFIDHVAEVAGMSRAAAARAVDAIFETAEGVISRVVHETGTFSLPGFGKFTKKTRAARQGRIPHIDAPIDIPERTTITFRPGKGFKEGTSSRRSPPNAGAEPASEGFAGGRGEGGYGGGTAAGGGYGGGTTAGAGYGGGGGYGGGTTAGGGYGGGTTAGGGYGGGGGGWGRAASGEGSSGGSGKGKRRRYRDGGLEEAADGGGFGGGFPGDEVPPVPQGRAKRSEPRPRPAEEPAKPVGVNVSGDGNEVSGADDVIVERAEIPESGPPPASVSEPGLTPPAHVPEPVSAAAEPRPARAVNNGFAAPENPGTPLPRDRTLQLGREYVFWLEVGGLVAGSIATEMTELDTRDVAAGSHIDVVLFPVGDGFRVLADLGRLRLEADGSVAVARQPGTTAESEDKARGHRLFFPLVAPGTAGEHRLRCNLYHGATLLQSWLIRARVEQAPRTEPGALSSTADYVLSHALHPARVRSLGEHRLSVLMNGNGDGTHSFFFKGAEEHRHQATLEAHTLQDLIETGRGALRRAAWNDDEPWAQGKPYLYGDGRRDLERLRMDLERLARRGYDFYDALAGELADGYEAEERLRALMRRPGMVQIASRESAAHVVPAALFYDSILDRGSQASFTLCPAFVQALDDPRPLEEQPCFRGDCVSADKDDVVCPSGFWGFRHALGMPLSIGDEAPDVEETLAYPTAPGMAVAVWRDFVRRADHETRLRALRPDLVWEYADTREETLALLASTRSPVVYFYCHGGLDKHVPYLLVGGKGEGFIAPSSFRGKIRWKEPRPLVFINGCETGALEPETALDLVSALVERANASGVIGTEITIFEPLACEFAEEFLRRFVVEGQPLGEAVRNTRLALLKRGNPLGLVYIPFAIAGLHLVKQGAP